MLLQAVRQLEFREQHRTARKTYHLLVELSLELRKGLLPLAEYLPYLSQERQRGQCFVVLLPLREYRRDLWLQERQIIHLLQVGPR